MNKVTNLKEVDDKPDEDIILMLKEWIELVKQGQVTSVAITGKTREGTVRSGYAGNWDGDLDVAGYLDQQSFNYRAYMFESIQNADPVDVPEDDEDDDA